MHAKDLVHVRSGVEPQPSGVDTQPSGVSLDMRACDELGRVGILVCTRGSSGVCPADPGAMLYPSDLLSDVVWCGSRSRFCSGTGLRLGPEPIPDKNTRPVPEISLDGL